MKEKNERKTDSKKWDEKAKDRIKECLTVRYHDVVEQITSKGILQQADLLILMQFFHELGATEARKLLGWHNHNVQHQR